MYEISNLLGESDSESEYDGGAPAKQGVDRSTWPSIRPGGVWKYVKSKDNKTMSGTMTANTGTMFSFSSDPNNPNAFRTNINHKNIKSLEMIKDAPMPEVPVPKPEHRSFSPVKEVNLNFGDVDGKLRQILSAPPPNEPGLRADVEDLRRDVELMRSDIKALHTPVKEIAERL
jgi:hypothetical protein